MTIDEAITREREKAEIHRFNSCYIDAELYADDLEEIENAKERCIKCAEEHEQLAELFEELKAYREIGTVEECKESVLDIEKAYNKGYADGSLSVTSEIRNKVIDDFVKEICKMIVKSENNGNYRFYAVEIKQTIADLAEQMKEGGEND